MSLLRPSVTQIDKYSFLVKDLTTDQTYSDAGVNLATVAAATLTIKKAYQPTAESTHTINILPDWAFLLADGITINIADLPDALFDSLEFFPDWFYEIVITYTYNTRSYTKKTTTGFRATISDIVMQQLQQSDWVKELKCGCGCEKYSTAFRKFNYLKVLEIASDNCLIMQYQEILLALYKLSGQTHEYSD
jgi:hypothetical protein